MRSKNLTRRAMYAALSFTFAGTLFSQTLEKNQQSGEATPNLMASITKFDISRYETPQEGVSKETVPPIAGSLSKADSSIDLMLTPPKFNTMASVQEKSPAHNSAIRVEPDVLPLNVRLDPTYLQRYGAAPAVMRLSFGRK